jgi:hypothetical protein
MKAWPISARVNGPKNNEAILFCRSNLNPWREAKVFRDRFDAMSQRPRPKKLAEAVVSTSQSCGEQLAR